MKEVSTALPSLTALRAFEVAARHGSFTRAAEELSMTQAAVSYQVKRLEEMLAQPLFRRNGRYIELTESGHRLALTVAESFELIRATVASLATHAEARIAISALPTIASHWLVPRLGRFQMSRPDLAVRLDTSIATVDVVGEIDVAVRTGEGIWPGCEAHLLFDSDYTILCAPELVQTGKLRAITDVLGVPRFGREAWWDVWLAEAQVEASRSGASPISDLGMQANEVAAAVSQGGVALVTPRFFGSEIASGRLAMPFPTRVREKRGYWLVHRRGPLPDKVRAFREWVLAEARADLSTVGSSPVETASE